MYGTRGYSLLRGKNEDKGTSLLVFGVYDYFFRMQEKAG